MGKQITSSVISGALSFGIGSVVSGLTGVLKAVVQVGLHGIARGLMSEFNGGKFISGFASGVVSSLVSSGVEALGNSSVKLEGVMPTGIGGTFLPEFSTFASRNPGLFKAIMLVSSGLSGGKSSSIAGGKFIDGLKQGFVNRQQKVDTNI